MSHVKVVQYKGCLHFCAHHSPALFFYLKYFNLKFTFQKMYIDPIIRDYIVRNGLQNLHILFRQVSPITLEIYIYLYNQGMLNIPPDYDQ